MDLFVQRLVAMFDINHYHEKTIDIKNYKNFTITHSTNDEDIPFITPDLATCADCENELKDENNRRHRHAFISCVNCGPRYTIINSLPYDRERTVMGRFDLCDDCKAEYTDPADRRCHAQTIACRHCGPETNITIEESIQLLQNGNVLAIKDIGGYHLAGICTSGTAKKIRMLKGRDKKPFAIMFKSLDELKEYSKINKKEEALLLSPARPIVLLEKIKETESGICDDSDYIGAFLPCNPIQIMILEKVSPLIMTSANLSGEPIITDDEQIKKFGIAVLSHNRDILTPIDDSVVQINAGRTQFIRRARGYVPLAIDMGIKAEKPMLCMGGDLKSAFAIVKDNYVFPSQYFGDLEDKDYFDAYINNIHRFKKLHSFQEELVVCDKHPLYHSSQIFDSPVKIQHHLAHAYSVIAEHKLKGDTLNFVFDGTGYGDDGAIWGGEVFLNTKRVEHLKYTKMIASDEIAKNADLALACYDKSNALINKAIENNINTVFSSSMGRLFDAVCAALDIKHYNTFEGECAIALERCAKKAKKAFYISPDLDPENIIKQIKKADAPKEETALGFHIMLCELILEISKKYNVKQITLSGGCFVNRILLSNTVALLEKNNFKVYTNELVSCGDNGICLGQAYLAALEE